MSTVCVTGASGFIGAHVVKALLEKGYKVHATVRDPSNQEKVRHLTQLPGASENLTLFKADLLDEGSFDEVVSQCVGVFHTASPFFFSVKDPEQDLLKPAKEGTLNVLRSVAKAPSVKRVIVTSSVAAIAYNGGRLPNDHVYSGADWSHEDYLREKGFWYPLSKTLAEKAAWDFIKDLKESGREITLATVNPTLVIGPMLQSTLNTSSEFVKSLLDGSKQQIPNASMGYVDVRDVASAHILVYESEAEDRYMAMSGSFLQKDWCKILREIEPDAKIPTEVAPGDEASPMKFDNSKLTNLAWSQVDFKTSLADTVSSLKQFNYYP